MDNILASLLRCQGDTWLAGTTALGYGQQKTGILSFYSVSSVHALSFQAGNTAAATTYTLPTNFPATSGSGLTSTTAGILSWAVLAPSDATYVTLSTNTTLTNERVLTAGTAISVVDAGAGSTVTVNNTGVTSAVAGTAISVSGATGAVTINNTGVTSITGTTSQITASAATGAITLSLPQNIHTAAVPRFDGLGIGQAATQLVDILGEASGDNNIQLLFTNSGTGISLIRSRNSGSGSLIQMSAYGSGTSGNHFTSPTTPTADSALIYIAGASNALIYSDANACPLTIGTTGTTSPLYFRTNSTVRFTVDDALITLSVIPKFGGTNSTGAGAALLGSNSPASTLTAPYTWISAQSADGSTVYIPAWK